MDRVRWLALPLVFLLLSGGIAAAAVTEAEQATAAHVLNRLGYGPRPGEVERVAAQGVPSWIRAQLQPEGLPDAAAQAAVAKLTHLQLTPAALVTAYHEQRNQAQKANAAKATEGEPMQATRPRTAQDDPLRSVVAQALGELQYAKLTRAVRSERQLEEVLVDFWFNHFNVDVRKQAVRATVVTYEQDTIRPHVFGRFRDLLGATAQSPAMLVYLDNARSSRERELTDRERARQRQAGAKTMGPDGEAAAPAARPRKGGLNENYGRELLELHTLGVDGGYTQRDVQEVARVFTGWTVDPRDGRFVFRERMHDPKPKTVLGTKIKGGGQAEGERVLDLLATHPATARHLATKLCQRFVADTPPAALVERVAAEFRASDGDLRRTYAALFASPEFLGPEYRGAKTKSPFEFLASALRATGATLVEVPPRAGRPPVHAVEAGLVFGRGAERIAALPRRTALMHLVEMGQPLYAWGPPTGFPEDSSHWVNAGALVARLNFALALTGGQVADCRVEPGPLLRGADTDEPASVITTLGRTVLGKEPGENTRRIVLAQLEESAGGEATPINSRKALALLLGAPEFQRR
ncbi:hypothetical protein Verru16b_00708 [Lacunisphaera limnophila]|uniref:DUF1800 domain-containing protein n=1 Tax=Lacunisphaera limnophila TaxID=1838286 RepID=A0A1D8AS02_9BACT|nr:DUF1800 domain-containing protein [Lacunisphaera limnophila]AOS43656.1 hypothetical protein Verru16b_00708 [Lacunisphaera limnophila]